MADVSEPAAPVGPLVEVDDVADPRLDLYRALNDPAGRADLEAGRGVFVVEGRLAVERLLTSAYPVRSVLVDAHQAEVAGQLVAAARDRGAPVYVGTRALLAATVGFSLHRGVVAVAERPAPTDPARLVAEVVAAPTGRTRLVAVLEGLNDHENIGALFRNAAAFGVAGVLLDPTCADPLYRRSVRVSVGHVLHLPFARLSPWPAGLDQLRAAGFLVAALAPRPPAGGRGRTLGQLASSLAPGGPPAAVAVVLGAEGPGLREATLRAADVVVGIPMAEGVDSLNVAAAGAILMHWMTA